jgi:transposase
MLPYSLDLRHRVVAAYEEGVETIAEIAERFAVGQTFVKKMLRQKRETGSLAIQKPNSGAKKLLSKKDFKWLRRQIEKEPDLTIDQLHERINQERQVKVSRATVGRAVQALKLPLKKRVNPLKRETTANVPGIGGALEN